MLLQKGTERDEKKSTVLGYYVSDHLGLRVLIAYGNACSKYKRFDFRAE